jgi:K+-sensing histidine kinase KdpD
MTEPHQDQPPSHAHPTASGRAREFVRRHPHSKRAAPIWNHQEDYDIAGALIRFALQRRITHIVLGPGRRGRWHGMGSPVVRRILRQATPAGIDVHVMAMGDRPWGYRPAG